MARVRENQPSAPAGGVSIGGPTVGYMYETIDGQRVERRTIIDAPCLGPEHLPVYPAWKE